MSDDTATDVIGPERKGGNKGSSAEQARSRGEAFETRRLLLKRLPALVKSLLVLVIVAAFIQSGVRASSFTAFTRSLLWGLVLIASFVGWGSALNRILLGHEKVSLGLRASWGVAVVIALGGVACAFRAGTRPLLLALVGAGLAVLIYEIVRAKFSRSMLLTAFAECRLRPLFWILVALCLSVAGLQLAGWTAWDDMSPRDDMPAYFVLAREITDRGGLNQPFSFRRMCVLGGHQLLHALHLASGAPAQQLHMVDGGIAVILLIWLILGLKRDARRRSLGLMLGLMVLLVTLPFTRVNTASQNTTLLMAVAVFRTWELRAFQQSPRLRKHVAIGIVVAALCSLRNSNVVPAAILVAFLYLVTLPAAPRRWRFPELLAWLKGAGIASLAAFGALLAWSIANFRASRSFLFPLQMGNFLRDYGPIPVDPREFHTVMTTLLGVLGASSVVWIPFALAAASTLEARRLLGPALAFFSVVVGVAYNVPGGLGLMNDLGRYVYGFQYAFIIATGIVVAEVPLLGRMGSHARAAAAFVAAGLALHLTERWADFLNWHKRLIGLTHTALEVTEPADIYRKDRTAAYEELQAGVPERQRILAMVDEPYRFDFRRNPIWILDLPGAVSPRPGLPFREGAESIVTYLRSQRIRYVIVVKSDASKALYRREEWAHWLADKGLQGKFAASMVTALDAFGRLPGSAALKTVAGMTLYDLGEE